LWRFGEIKARRLRWAEHITFMEDMIDSFKLFVGKSEGKGPLGRARSRWDDITMDLREIMWEVGDWMHLAQDRNQWRAVVNKVMNLRLP
jgi:hypothetical protein